MHTHVVASLIERAGDMTIFACVCIVFLIFLHYTKGKDP